MSTKATLIHILQPGGDLLAIYGKDKELLVRITRDLEVTFGASYSPDVAAQQFWYAMARCSHEPRVISWPA